MKILFQPIQKNPEDHKASAWNSRLLLIMGPFHVSRAANNSLFRKTKIKKMAIHIFKILKDG